MSWTRLDEITAEILKRAQRNLICDGSDEQRELFPVCDQCGCEFKASFSLSLCERCLVKANER